MLDERRAAAAGGPEPTEVAAVPDRLARGRRHRRHAISATARHGLLRARPTPPTPGRAGSRSSRCRPTSIPAWCCCSTGRARAAWATRQRRAPASRSAVHIDGRGRRGECRPSISNPFGFADFFAGGDAVHVARAVSIAETVGGARQRARRRAHAPGRREFPAAHLLPGRRSTAGTIDGKAPGHADLRRVGGRALPIQTTRRPQRHLRAGLRPVQPGAAAGRRCQRHHRHAPRQPHAPAPSTGPSPTPTRRSPASPSVHMLELRVSTPGAGRTPIGCGDHDFNDLTVQLDFTSAHGHGWLI